MSIGCAGRARRSRYVVMHLRHNAETLAYSSGGIMAIARGQYPCTLLCFTCSAAVSIKRWQILPSRLTTRRRREMHNLTFVRRNREWNHNQNHHSVTICNVIPDLYKISRYKDDQTVTFRQRIAIAKFKRSKSWSAESRIFFETFYRERKIHR